MGLDHTPLDPGVLSPAAQKALTGPAKLMAAKGLAPIPNATDLVSVLYQLSGDGDTKIASAAQNSLSAVPAKVVLAAAADTACDPRVLDLLAQRFEADAPVVEAILLNPSCADETLVDITAKGSEGQLDLIAQNESRILRHPDIVRALYFNTNARIATVDRVVELAIRSEIKVPGIPAWDELKTALLGGGAAASKKGQDVPLDDLDDELKLVDDDLDDELFDDADTAAEIERAYKEALETAQNDNAPVASPTSMAKLTVPMKIRLATLGNKFQRALFVRDSTKMVAMAAIKAPGVTDSEAAKYAGNQSLCDDVISYIAARREWTKNYGVKLSLVSNPKTPITIAIRFLAFLRDRDLKQIARSKGVPSAVTAQAKKKLAEKQRLNKK